MERILLVDYREGSAFEGPIGPDFISFGNYKTLREVSSSLDHPHIFFPECNSQVNAEVQKRQMICFLKEQSKKGTLLVSRDHVMSYHFATGILKNEQKQGKKYGKIGYLVVDQHMDIYSHSTNGEDINKATVFRDLIEKGFVDLAVFIGIRPLEESLYHEIGGLNPFESEYATKQRGRGIMSGLEGKVMIIPSTDVGSLSDAVGKGIDMMQSEGISHFFFDTDLDSFDSTVIKGVDYCLQLPVQAIKCMFDKFPKESGMLYSIAEASRDHRLSAALKRLRLSLGEIRKNGNDETDINNISGYAYDAYLQLRAVVGSASYSSRSIDVFIKKLIDVSETALYEMRKINQKGLPIDNIDAELKKLRETLEGKCLLGIDVTEFEPGNDYNGKTESLLKKLIHNLYGLNAR